VEAIILAGGKGTRLRSVISNIPKPMALVGGRPFLEILLTQLQNKGFTKIILSLGYMADNIVDYFGGSFLGMELVYEIEAFPLGTGGAVSAAIKRCLGDHVYIFNGDTFLDIDVSLAEKFWSSKKQSFLIGCEVGDTSRYGRLSVAGDKVVGFSEKGVVGRGLINAGCYVIEPEFFMRYQHPPPFSFETDFLETIIIHGLLNILICEGRFIDIGVPEDYARAQIELKN